MAKYGYDVTVFEALHEVGGVLKYGIPEFRLPNKIVDVEIDNLARMGVTFLKDCIVGKTIDIEDLKKEGFKGFFVASGAGLPNFMNIPGENSINVMSSNEYLTRVNLMDAASEDSDTPVTFGKNVAVIGGETRRWIRYEPQKDSERNAPSSSTAVRKKKCRHA